MKKKSVFCVFLFCVMTFGQFIITNNVDASTYYNNEISYDDLFDNEIEVVPTRKEYRKCNNSTFNKWEKSNKNWWI